MKNKKYFTMNMSTDVIIGADSRNLFPSGLITLSTGKTFDISRAGISCLNKRHSLHRAKWMMENENEKFYLKNYREKGKSVTC